MHLGTIKLSVHIESPLGILNLRRIAEAGSRIESMSMGVDDYCLQLGVTPSSDATELLFPFMHMVTVCKAYNIHPIGILGSVADFRRLEHFRAAAIKAEKLGATGAYCIHPDQVEILNTVFSPSPADLEWAEGVIAVFEEALQQGRASTSLDGKMVDTPIYKRALNTIERARELQKSDARKTQALAVANDPA
jgi:citrate lyase subunit beta/citryl-CoA lyase